MNQNFNFWIPATIEKAKNNSTGEEVMRIKGIASTIDEDSEGEVLEPIGFDLSRFLKTGFINWNHQAKNDPSKVIGEPDVARVIDGGKKLYIEGNLYKDHPLAVSTYQLAETLKKNNSKRKLGFSIEGKALERDPMNPKRITKALITGVAVTPSPVNQNTLVDLVKGEQEVDFVDYKFEEDIELNKIEKGEFLYEFNVGDKIYGITKSFDCVEKSDLEKSRSGVYINNSENRRLNRVGQRYGSREESIKLKEDFVDEDTSEVISIDRKISQKFYPISEFIRDKKNLKKLRKDIIDAQNKFKPFQENYYNASFNLKNIEQEIKDLISEKRQLNIEMEQDIAYIGSESDERINDQNFNVDHEKDRVANEYGGKLNELEDKKLYLKNRYKKALDDYNESRDVWFNESFKVDNKRAKFDDALNKFESKYSKNSDFFENKEKSIVPDIEKEEYESQKKIKKVMSEFKAGTLKDSHGNKVTDRDQALAIAMSEAGISKEKAMDTTSTAPLIPESLDPKHKEVLKKAIVNGILPLKSLIQKGGRKAVLGEVREWKGQKYRKTPQGWEPITEGKSKVKQKEESKEKFSVWDEAKKIKSKLMEAKGDNFEEEAFKLFQQNKHKDDKFSTPIKFMRYAWGEAYKNNQTIIYIKERLKGISSEESNKISSKKQDKANKDADRRYKKMVPRY